jgi:hypothetical protein
VHPSWRPPWGNYARWLALSYSHFDEAIPLLETLDGFPERAQLLALARLKVDQLSHRTSTAPSAPTPDSSGATRRRNDFGAFAGIPVARCRK